MQSFPVVQVLYFSDFAFHGFQSWQQYSSREMKIDFKSVSMRDRSRDWNTIYAHPFWPVAFQTIHFEYEEWKWQCCSSLCLDLWLVLCRQYLNHHQMIVDFIFCSFPYRSSNMLALNFILLSAHLYRLCIFFVAFVCPFHLLFLEGRRIRVSSPKQDLLSAISLFISDICVRNRRGLTLILGVPYFWLELHLMLFHWRQHIIVCLIENCVSIHQLYH